MGKRIHFRYDALLAKLGGTMRSKQKKGCPAERRGKNASSPALKRYKLHRRAGTPATTWRKRRCFRAVIRVRLDRSRELQECRNWAEPLDRSRNPVRMRLQRYRLDTIYIHSIHDALLARARRGIEVGGPPITPQLKHFAQRQKRKRQKTSQTAIARRLRTLSMRALRNKCRKSSIAACVNATFRDESRNRGKVGFHRQWAEGLCCR